MKEAIFQVWNKGALSSDYIGVVSMAVSELVDGVPRDDWFVLKNNKGTKDRGEIHLQVMYLEPGDDLTKERHEFAYPLQTLLRKGKLALDGDDGAVARPRQAGPQRLHGSPGCFGAGHV